MNTCTRYNVEMRESRGRPLTHGLTTKWEAISVGSQDLANRNQDDAKSRASESTCSQFWPLLIIIYVTISTRRSSASLSSSSLRWSDSFQLQHTERVYSPSCLSFLWRYADIRQGAHQQDDRIGNRVLRHHRQLGNVMGLQTRTG
jgi:hypothetical protein